MPMKPSVKLRPAPWDALVILIILAAAVASGLYFWGQSRGAEGDLTAVISQDGKVIQTVDLTTMKEDHTEITVGGAYTNVIELERDRVRMESSDCPTQDCVHTGWISQPGQSIVCLPNRLVVELVGGGSPDVDVVIG